MSHRRAALLPAAGLVLAAALAACGGRADGSPAAKPSAPATVLHVGIDGSRFTGVPAAVRPGTVSLTFTNGTAAVHMAAVARLAAGHSAAEIPVFLASPDGQQGPPPWLSLVGGVDELEPGHTASWTGSLDPGSYAVVSLSQGASGRPDVADGLLAPFTARGAAVHTAALASQATATLGAGGTLTMTPIPVGATAILLRNDDSMPRTVDVTAVRPGRTYDDVMAEAHQGNGLPPSLMQLGGTGVPPHGTAVVGIEPARSGTTYVVVDLDHVAEGAVAPETVP